VIQKGSESENSAVVAYGAEGLKNPRNELYLVHNTLVNGSPYAARFVRLAPGASVFKVINNIFVGSGVFPAESENRNGNLRSDKSDFVDAAHFDYRLRREAKARSAGIDPGQANGFPLSADAEYVHKASGRPRSTFVPLDVGAHPYSGAP
jgi:hypothetical protein